MGIFDKLRKLGEPRGPLADIEARLAPRFEALERSGRGPPMLSGGAVRLEHEGRLVALGRGVEGRELPARFDAETFLVAAREGRAVFAVAQGHERDMRTIVAGLVTMAELSEALDAASDTWLDAVEGAFARAEDEVARLARARGALRRWAFDDLPATKPPLFGVVASVASVAIDGARARVVHAGECSAWRLRSGVLANVACPHTAEARAGDGAPRLESFTAHGHPTALVGGGARVGEVRDLDVEPGDVFVLATSIATSVLVRHAAAIAGELDARGLDGAASAILDRIEPDDRDHYPATLILARAEAVDAPRQPIDGTAPR
jgi:hypothetical protein